jgi:hypothetical protein
MNVIVARIVRKVIRNINDKCKTKNNQPRKEEKVYEIAFLLILRKLATNYVFIHALLAFRVGKAL